MEIYELKRKLLTDQSTTGFTNKASTLNNAMIIAGMHNINVETYLSSH